MIKERFDPNDNSFALQTKRHHIERYEFASKIKGDKYFDMCCGQGYGLNILKKANPNSLARGVDINYNVIERARREYGQCEYMCADVTKYKCSDSPKPEFDVVTFFEAIEHMPHDKGRGVIDYIYKELLNDGGQLVLSVPKDIKEDENHYHISRWDIDMLKEILKVLFSEVNILGQSWEAGVISDDLIDNDFFIYVCTK